MKAVFEDAKTHLNNELAVAGKVLPAVPGAVWDELSNDWSNHRGDLLKNVATAAATGLAAGVLFSRSPCLAKAAFGAIGLYQGWGIVSGGGQMLSQAWDAGSDDERQSVSLNITRNLGRAGASFAETMPAAIAGGISGTYIASRSPFIQSNLFALEKQARISTPESLHYLGPGAQSLNIAAAEGRFDLLSLSERMSKAQVWSNLEEGRFFKVAADGQARIGRALPGTPVETFMGRQSDNVFHTHLDRIAPTSGDFFAARKAGVISVPRRGLTVFYEGLGDQLAEVRTSVNSGSGVPEGISFRSLVLDKQQQLAVRVESLWKPQVGLEPVRLHALDYSDAVRTLSGWDGGRLNLTQIKSAPQMLLKPGMTELLRQLTIEASKGA